MREMFPGVLEQMRCRLCQTGLFGGSKQRVDEAEHHLMLRVYFRIAKLVAILPFDCHMRFSEMKIVVPCHPDCFGTD